MPTNAPLLQTIAFGFLLTATATLLTLAWFASPHTRHPPPLVAVRPACVMPLAAPFPL